MKTVSVHLGAQNFATAITDGTHRWVNDEPLEKGGSDTGPDPFATLLGSLGSCTAITLKMYAARKGWDLQEVRVKLDLANETTGEEKSATFTSEITVAGNLDESQLQRLRQIAKACPVSKLFEGRIGIETIIQHKTDEHTAAG